MTERRVNRGRRKEDNVVRDRFLWLRKLFEYFLIIAFLVAASTALHFYYSYERALEAIENIAKQYVDDTNKKGARR